MPSENVFDHHLSNGNILKSRVYKFKPSGNFHVVQKMTTSEGVTISESGYVGSPEWLGLTDEDVRLALMTKK